MPSAITTSSTLPDKSFFKPKEISSLLNVKPHVIFYWEAEFNEIKSERSKDGQRQYRREDVLLMSAIRHLLYEKKFTISGARKIIRESNGLYQQSALRDDSFLEEATEAISVTEETFNQKTLDIYESIGSQMADKKIEIENTNQAQKRPSITDYENAIEVLFSYKESLKLLIAQINNFERTIDWPDWERLSLV